MPPNWGFHSGKSAARVGYKSVQFEGSDFVRIGRSQQLFFLIEINSTLGEYVISADCSQLMMMSPLT